MENDLRERLVKLNEKYEAMGQDINSYLDGLLLSNYLTYWDYIKVDQLLSLQEPKTDFPDELVFIMYHQSTEIYFKLILHEMKQISNNGLNIQPNGHNLGWKSQLEVRFFIERMKRINRYFDALVNSFAIMIDGIEPEQFRLFRMALLPASGFQSAQYRMIEILATDMINLVSKDKRKELVKKNASLSEQFEQIYWKQGATELETGKKTLTLKQFEKKYSAEFIKLATEYADKNLWRKYSTLGEKDKKNEELIQVLKAFDQLVNVKWPLVHYKSAARYLQSDDASAKATGGTNWQKYLPPRFQKRIFYPEFWSAEEIEKWGT